MLGEKLGPYRIERELGSGGMGKVYAATGPEGVVALKIVHPHLLEQPGFFKRFLREADIGKSVRHPNVVRTLDCDAIGGHHYLVMEYVEGQTLADLQRELDKVPEELCRHVAREICKGLAAIHGAGIVHRDLKPENVLITEDNEVKVMDLGVARLQNESIRLSQSGAFVGSLQYAAPEAFRDGGSDLDGRADLHALGLLLYELSCGVNPYVADDVPKTVRKVLHEEPRRLGDANPQISPFFEEVVHRLLAKDPGSRFSSADELLQVLEAGEDSTWWNQHAAIIRSDDKRPLRRIRIPRETAVYGRENELAKLRALFDSAKSGDGQVVLVEGEAGIGKSRLVDELIGRLRSDGEDLNFLFGSYPPGGAALAAGGFSSAYREQFGSEGSAPYLTVTPLLVPGFDAVLRGEPPPENELGLTKDSLETCFVHVTRALAKERPTVVLIDDLHFAPDDARALFTSLSRAVPGHRILLLGTTRPGVPEEWLANLTRPEHVAHLQVDRLGPKDLVRLLQDSFRSERLAEQLGIKIALKSDGNPFFAFEIIRGLREGRFITQANDGTWVGTKEIDEIEIPSSVLDLVNARVAGLAEDDRALLDVAACWGYEFDPRLVGDVLGLARVPTLRAFGQIERRHRLVRASGRTMVFDHHQVQEALYGSLLEPLREEYHAALAEALETREDAAERDPETLDGALCVDLCEHFFKGARREAALRYLEAAQKHLSKGYLHGQMVALGEHALAVPGLLTGAERAKTLLRLDSALTLIGRRERQEEVAREAERLAEDVDDDELRAKAATALGAVFRATARHGEAEAAFRHALDLARKRSDPKAEANTMGHLGLLFYVQGRLDEACEYCERYLALSRAVGYRQGEATATGNLGNVFWSQGRFAEAREYYERHLALSCEAGHREGEANATGNLGLVLWSQGRLEEAREHYQRSLALLREIGHRRGEAFVLHNLGGLLGDMGERAASEERLSACLTLCEEIGDRWLVSATHLVLGSLRVGAGDVEAGRASLVAARDLAAEIDAYANETVARCELACLPGGDADDALAGFAAHEERLKAGQRVEVRWRLFQATGDRTHLVKAKRLLDDLLAKNPLECHESMCQNVRVNREILAAWREEFGDDESPGESPTRAG